jgi:hypothetical protein
MQNPKTFICISIISKPIFKFISFKSLGNKVYLITSEKLRDNMPHDYIDETFYMEGKDIDWNLEHLLLGVGNL